MKSAFGETASKISRVEQCLPFLKNHLEVVSSIIELEYFVMTTHDDFPARNNQNFRRLITSGAHYRVF